MNTTFLPYLVCMPAFIKLEPSVFNSSISLQAASLSVSLSSLKRLFVTSVDVLKLAKWHANSKLAVWTYDEASKRWRLWCSGGFIYCFCLLSCLFFQVFACILLMKFLIAKAAPNIYPVYHDCWRTGSRSSVLILLTGIGNVLMM